MHKGVKCEQYKSGKMQHVTKKWDGPDSINTMRVVPFLKVGLLKPPNEDRFLWYGGNYRSNTTNIQCSSGLYYSLYHIE